MSNVDDSDNAEWLNPPPQEAPRVDREGRPRVGFENVWIESVTEDDGGPFAVVDDTGHVFMMRGTRDEAHTDATALGFRVQG